MPAQDIDCCLLFRSISARYHCLHDSNVLRVVDEWLGGVASARGTVRRVLELRHVTCNVASIKRHGVSASAALCAQPPLVDPEIAKVDQPQVYGIHLPSFRPILPTNATFSYAAVIVRALQLGCGLPVDYTQFPQRQGKIGAPYSVVPCPNSSSDKLPAYAARLLRV